MKKFGILKRITASMLALSVMLSFGACGINSPGTKEYVDNVRADMLEAVNLTRKLKSQQETLDVRRKADADETTKTLEALEDCYTDLIKLEAPSAYNELDNEIKTNAKSVLGYSGEMLSLVISALSTGNDQLYKQETPHIMQDYEESYTALVDLNSQVTTKYRND